MRPKDDYDAVVIGAGHNGLVAAAYLAKAGRKVLVVERREVLGGAAATEEVFPGFRANTGAEDVGLFLPQINQELSLERYGLRWLESPVLVSSLQTQGGPLTLWRDIRRSQEEIASFSTADAQRYPAYLEWITRAAGVLGEMMTRVPPAVPQVQIRQLLPWISTGLKARRLGRQGMMDFLRVLPMPAADFLDEWFETPALKAALGVQGVAGSRLGPRASGTAFMLLYQAIGAAGSFRASRYVAGGSGQLAEALSRAASDHGAEICTGIGVDRILVDGSRATGVKLSTGQEIQARIILSSVAPRYTFFDLVGAPNLDVRFVREVKNIRNGGAMSRVILALIDLPVFTGLEKTIASQGALLSGRLLICPGLDDLERASDEAKYGNIPGRLPLEITLPTVLDGSLAPSGQHLMSVNVLFTPYDLKTGDWETGGQLLRDRVLEQLETCAPGIGRLILHHKVITPLDLEREWGLPKGDIYHSEMGLDQLLFMRPVPGWAQYRTPVEGLFLCGAGAHPGGGVTGAPGYNAARVANRSLG